MTVVTSQTSAPVHTVDPRSRNVTWRVCQFVLQNIFCFWLQYRARGHEQLQESPGALLLANHQSYLDPLLVGLPLQRPVSFLARDSLFRVPVVGWILRQTYVMPINRDAASTASIRDCLRRLEQGYLVGIFPEGTRTSDGNLGELKPGFVAIVRRTDRPIIPIGIAGAFEALPRGAWWLRPARVRVVFGAPIERSELEPLLGKDRESELLELIRTRIAACCASAADWRTPALNQPQELVVSPSEPVRA